MSFWKTEDRPADSTYERALPFEPPQHLPEFAGPGEPDVAVAWSFGTNRHDEELEAGSEENLPVVEYRRRGLLRRKKLVATPTEPEDTRETTHEELEANGNGHAFAFELEAAPVADHRRRGFFRRHRFDPLPTTFEDELEGDPADPTIDSQGDDQPELSDEIQRWIESWKQSASEVAAELLDRESEEAEVEQAGEEAPDQDEVAFAPEEDFADEDPDPEAGVGEDPAIENGRRSFFWRRKEREVAGADEAEDSDQADEHDRDDIAAAALADEDEDERASFVPAADEEGEAVVEQPRRSFFRRRRPEPVDEVDEEAVAQSVEDDAFQNVDLYPGEATFAMAEEDESEPEAAPEPEPAPEVEAAPELEVTATDSVSEEIDQASDAESTEGVEELTAPVPTAQAEAEPESEPEPETHFEEPAVALEDKPVPLRKRNGGSSRAKKVVGLKVGASQLAAAVVAGSGDEPALVDLARRPLEQGVVVDGEVRDPEALAHALKTFFRDHHLPSKNVRLGLSSSRVGVRTFEIAGVEDESRFDNAVRFRAHEVLPVSAHESVLDYRVVGERYTESGEVVRHVLLVVAPRDQVQPYLDVCHEAGLRLAGVDLEAFGLLRAFVPPIGERNRSDDSATVVAAIGHEASTLLVAGGGLPEFTRVFDWGGGALQSAITDELEVPHMEAATILTHLSLSGPGRHLDSLDADARSRAVDAVRTRLMPFARELVSSLQFYQTQPESLGIREILITGGTSHLEGLADALHQMIGVSVRVGDPLARVTVQTEIPAALDATIGSLAVPIGLAIEDEPERSVNLLPKDLRQARKRPNVLAVAAPVAAVVPLAALGFLFVQANGTVGDRQSDLNAVRAQIEALPEPTRANIDPALVGEQAVRASAVAQILGGRLTWERVLGDISRVLPPGVSLTELGATAPAPTTPEAPSATAEDTAATPTESTPTPAAPETPTAVTITGYSLAYADIARTLARIQAVPSLSNAQLQSATPGLIGQKRVVEFTIVADLATRGGAQ